MRAQGGWVVKSYGAIEEILRSPIVARSTLAHVPKAALIRFPRPKVLWPFSQSTPLFKARNRRLDCVHYRSCNLVLYREDFFDLPIIAFRPDVITGLRVNKLRRDPNPPTATAHAAFYHVAHAQFSGDLLDVNRRPLYVKLELRAITNSERLRDSSVMMSSAMPSEKYSCSGSPLMLLNASTAIEGLSGSGKASRCPHERSLDGLRRAASA